MCQLRELGFNSETNKHVISLYRSKPNKAMEEE